MKGVLTGHPSRGLAAGAVIDVDRAEVRKFPTSPRYANTALT